MRFNPIKVITILFRKVDIRFCLSLICIVAITQIYIRICLYRLAVIFIHDIFNRHLAISLPASVLIYPFPYKVAHQKSGCNHSKQRYRQQNSCKNFYSQTLFHFIHIIVLLITCASPLLHFIALSPYNLQISRFRWIDF